MLSYVCLIYIGYIRKGFIVIYKLDTIALSTTQPINYTKNLLEYKNCNLKKKNNQKFYQGGISHYDIILKTYNPTD